MSRAAAATRPAPRGGSLDLVLVLVVLLAAWARTPVGSLGARAVYWVAGWEHSEPALTSYFRVHSAWDRVTHGLENPLPPPPPATDVVGLPEPWRTSAYMVLGAGSLPGVDAVYDGDPEAALEIAALGAEQRDRAIRRAEAAGVAEATTYRGHRDWLPAEAQVIGDEAVEGVLAVATLLNVQWPVATSWPVSSGWGNRIHPVTGDYKFHNGVDLAVPVGTPVLAAQGGEVAVVGEDARSGRYLVLDHGNGVRTSYCHLSTQDVVKGQHIARGEQIALSGNTGRSTGPHLHFVVRVHGKTVDPLPLRRSTDAS